MKSKSDDEKNFRNAVVAHSCRITHSFGTKECSHYLWSLRIEINSFPNHQSGMKTTNKFVSRCKTTSKTTLHLKVNRVNILYQNV